MARIYKPTRPKLDAQGQPVIGPDGKPVRVPRTENWVIRIYDSNGRAKDISTGTTLITKAKKMLHDLEAKKNKHEPIGAQVNTLTFDDARTDIVNDYKADGLRSLSHLERRIDKHLKPVFGGRRLVTITTADVRAFIASRLDAGAARAEINRELSALERMFSLAIEADKLTHRPRIKMLKERNTRTGFFERAQFEAVRAAHPEHPRPLVTFLYVTGWRDISESGKWTRARAWSRWTPTPRRTTSRASSPTSGSRS
jgi:hypothetical protein